MRSGIPVLCVCLVLGCAGTPPKAPPESPSAAGRAVEALAEDAGVALTEIGLTPAADAGTVSPAPVSVETAPAGAPQPTRTRADDTVEAFLVSLKAGDFVAAAAHFDATLGKALPADKLADLWSTQTTSLGPVMSWKIIQRAAFQGLDVRIALLAHAHGELRSTLSVEPDSQKLAGLFFQPVFQSESVPREASNLRVVDVSVGKSPYVLGGTLTLPEGSGPFPAVVFVHGSGPSDRDGTLGGNKILRDLAEGLGKHGIAALRYDKRTYRHGSQLSRAITLDEEVVDDAISAVQVLKKHPAIDKHRVFVIGHSLGAMLTPEIAVRSQPVAGAVLLAPPGLKPWDDVLRQLRYLETPPDQIAQIEMQVELLKQKKLGAGLLLGAPQSYWLDWASRDGVRMAKKLRKPILILRGDRDYQVTADDLALWQKGLSGRMGVTILTLPGDNHLFVQGTGKPGPAEYQQPGHVDSEAIDKIADFVLHAAAPLAPKRQR